MYFQLSVVATWGDLSVFTGCFLCVLVCLEDSTPLSYQCPVGFLRLQSADSHNNAGEQRLAPLSFRSTICWHKAWVMLRDTRNKKSCCEATRQLKRKQMLVSFLSNYTKVKSINSVLSLSVWQWRPNQEP